MLDKYLELSPAGDWDGGVGLCKNWLGATLRAPKFWPCPGIIIPSAPYQPNRTIQVTVFNTLCSLYKFIWSSIFPKIKFYYRFSVLQIHCRNIISLYALHAKHFKNNSVRCSNYGGQKYKQLIPTQTADSWCHIKHLKMHTGALF